MLKLISVKSFLKLTIQINNIYPPGDSLSYHNGMEFSTSDRDNDEWGGVDCAADYGAGNWWRSCGYNNINGKYGVSNGSTDFMYWFYFDNNNEYMSLKTMTLMFSEAD